MTFGASSAIFTQALISPLLYSAFGASITGHGTAATSFSDLASDAIMAALYNDTTTPDKDAAVASTGYNTGQWVTGNEETDSGGSNWPAGGVQLTSPALTTATGRVSFDAADTPGAGTVTLANVYGCLVYDGTVSGGTVADQGLCFNSFGGVQGVTGGTFTIVWDSTGVFKFTT